MRKLILGLIVATTASSSLAAAPKRACPIGRAVLVAAEGIYPMGRAHPEFVGKKFTVKRIAASFKKIPHDRVPGATWDVGTLKVELVGDVGAFVVDQNYHPGSSPAITGTSRLLLEDRAEAWSKKGRLPYPMPMEGGDSYLEVLSGPLSGLRFDLAACRRRKMSS